MRPHPVETGARIKTLHSAFAEASFFAYERFLSNQEHLQDNPEEFQDSSNGALIAGVETIVFSAMCFEAAIFDYAAWQLGDSYAKDHLEKLDVIAKWIIVPKLVCQAEIRKDRAPFARFKQLITARNHLVHHKSEPFKFGDIEQLNKLERENRKFVEDVHNAVRALVLMSFEMEVLIGPIHNPLPSYNSKVSLGLAPSPQMANVIAECKKVFKRT